MDWQPIETAPRDGAYIICNDRHEVGFASMDNIDQPICCGLTWGSKLTHWMPLPDPPKGADLPAEIPTRLNQSFTLGNFRSIGDSILVHGIDLEMRDGEWCPVVPCMGPLCDVAQANADCKEFQWLAEDRKWIPIRV